MISGTSPRSPSSAGENEQRRYCSAMKLAVLVMGWSLVLGAAPPAHADDDDDTAYLAAVASIGVPANSPATSTTYGRDLCDRISTVGFDPLVEVVHRDNRAVGVTTHQSALIVGAAISNYCLDKTVLLPKTLDY